MSSSAPSPGEVLEAFDGLAPPGTPLSTPEVAAEFDCTARTIYNKLEGLVEEGPLETKKVGSRGRVWWRPATARPGDDSAHEDEESTGEGSGQDVFDRQARFLDAVLSNVDDYVYVWNREKELVYTKRAVGGVLGDRGRGIPREDQPGVGNALRGRTENRDDVTADAPSPTSNSARFP